MRSFALFVVLALTGAAIAQIPPANVRWFGSSASSPGGGFEEVSPKRVELDQWPAGWGYVGNGGWVEETVYWARSNPSILFTDLYLSRNNGVNWERIPRNARVSPANPARLLWVDPSDSRKLYLSTNYGASWTLIRTAPSGQTLDAQWHPENPAAFALYEGTGSGSLRLSFDLGQNYSASVATDADFRTRSYWSGVTGSQQFSLFAGTSVQWWDGLVWNSATISGANTRMVPSEMVDGRFYRIQPAGDSEKLEVSQDRGATWSLVSMVPIPLSPLPRRRTLTVVPNSADEFYLGGGTVIYRSGAQGQTWAQFATTSFPNAKFSVGRIEESMAGPNHLLAHPSRPNEVVVRGESSVVGQGSHPSVPTGIWRVVGGTTVTVVDAHGDMPRPGDVGDIHPLLPNFVIAPDWRRSNVLLTDWTNLKRFAAQEPVASSSRREHFRVAVPGQHYFGYTNTGVYARFDSQTDVSPTFVQGGQVPVGTNAWVEFQAGGIARRIEGQTTATVTQAFASGEWGIDFEASRRNGNRVFAFTNQRGFVSSDAGLTWTSFALPANLDYTLARDAFVESLRADLDVLLVAKEASGASVVMRNTNVLSGTWSLVHRNQDLNHATTGADFDPIFSNTIYLSRVARSPLMRRGANLYDLGPLAPQVQNWVLNDSEYGIQSTLAHLYVKSPHGLFRIAYLQGLAHCRVESAQVYGGQAIKLNVGLTGIASYGERVLISDNSPLVGTPAYLDIPAGQQEAELSIGTFKVTAPAAVTLTAKFGEDARTASVQLVPVPRPIGLVMGAIPDGGQVSRLATLRFASPIPSALTYRLQSTNPAFQLREAELVVPAGATTATFWVDVPFATADATGTITATSLIDSASTRHRVLEVKRLAKLTVVQALGQWRSQGSGRFRLTLDRPAPAQGLRVTSLLSTGSAVVHTVPAGATSFEGSIPVLRLSVPTVATLTVSAAGSVRTVSILIRP